MDVLRALKAIKNSDSTSTVKFNDPILGDREVLFRVVAKWAIEEIEEKERSLEQCRKTILNLRRECSQNGRGI